MRRNLVHLLLALGAVSVFAGYLLSSYALSIPNQAIICSFLQTTICPSTRWYVPELYGGLAFMTAGLFSVALGSSVLSAERNKITQRNVGRLLLGFGVILAAAGYLAFSYAQYLSIHSGECFGLVCQVNQASEYGFYGGITLIGAGILSVAFGGFSMVKERNKLSIALSQSRR